MDIENEVREAIVLKGHSIRPPEYLKDKVLRKVRAEANKISLIGRYRQLTWTVRIAIFAMALVILSGFTYAATTYFHYMDLRNSKGQIQHRLFVGEPKDFEGIPTSTGGWRFYDPKLSEKVNEAALLINYDYSSWPATLDDLRKVFPEFKMPTSYRLVFAEVAYGYDDLTEPEQSALKAEAIKEQRRIDKSLVKSKDIDGVQLHYVNGADLFTLRVLSFNNDDAVGWFRNKYGLTQQFFTFPNEDTLQERVSIGQYDASYVRNGVFQAVVWEEEEHKLQYTVVSQDQGRTKEELMAIASELEYPSGTK
ncbi:hypothetical protein [Cohnella yongneupensis]|uniref:DUF4367 domain-containing protein n=1 Tax=Cohnella yongneupensis TaxID=425006 RepID=A0ABW0R3W3_9BACL